MNFGILLVYWIDYGLSGYSDSFAWRVPVILQCFFIIPMLFIVFAIPESPRWLVAHGRADDALEVLKRLRGGKDDESTIERLHQEIVETVTVESSLGVGSWKDLLKSDRIKSRRRLLIACAIQSFQQLGGINAIICKPSLNARRLNRLTISRLLRYLVRAEHWI